MTPERKTLLIKHSGNNYNLKSVAFSEWKIQKHSQEDVTGNTCSLTLAVSRNLACNLIEDYVDKLQQ